MTIVCIGVATRPQKHHPSFLPSPPPPLNLQTVKALLFRQSPFVNPTLKLGFFCDPQNIKRLSSFISSYLLKVTKFLVKISQFEFLLMAEQSMFINFFVIKYSGFPFIFYLKIATPPPPEKSHPIFPSNFPLKTEVLSSPLPPLKIW